jgi:NADH-quinone oxidoreductase subunit B
MSPANFKKEACMAIEGLMKEGFVTASLDSIINWARTGSL